MNFIKRWWNDRQKRRCIRGQHNWTQVSWDRTQCVDPGCGRYLR